MGTQVFNAKPIAKSDVAHVLGEAIRQPDHCLHVPTPKAPQFLIGTPEDYEAMMAGILRDCETVKRMRKNRNGVEKPQAIRGIEAVMLAGVASYPDDLAKNEPELFQIWLDKTVEFLRQEYGDSLRSAMVHLDETHPHIHFFVVPDGLDVATVFEPHRIRRENPTLTKREMKKHELEALRRQQNRYQEQVGMYTGLARFGPKSRSLKRGEWKREKENSLATARASAKLTKDTNSVKKELGALIPKANAHAAKILKAAQTRGEEILAESESTANSFGARIGSAFKGLIHSDAVEEEKERSRKQQKAWEAEREAEREDYESRLREEIARNGVLMLRLDGKDEKIKELTSTISSLSTRATAYGVPVNDILNPSAAPTPSVKPSPPRPTAKRPSFDDDEGPK